MDSPIQLDGNGLLLCPACKADTTHTEIVRVAARQEDTDFNEITVNALTGQVVTHGPQPAPAGPALREGRRQRIAVTGYCDEGAHSFALVFTQHKGGTYVEMVTPIPHEVDGDPTAHAPL